MPSNYPAGYDDLPDPLPTDTLDSLTVPHAGLHGDLNDAVEAIQQTLGTNPQGAHPTVRDRLAGLGFAAMTSTTGRAIGNGSKTFTVNNIGWYIVGTRVRVMDAADPAVNWMEGVITAITGLDVTVLIDTNRGSGTKSDWTFTVAGSPGVNGADGLNGSDGATGPVGPSGIVASCTSTTRPADPTLTPVIYETDTYKLMRWDGAAWVEAGAGGGGMSDPIPFFLMGA